MLNEKIIYYRKRNMMTQEELAERLHVSRQTITKWESGMIYPGLEYLVDLSHLFGVTIDYLVKDDDCVSNEKNDYDESELIKFIIKAKKSTYAKKQNKINSIRLGSHDYMFQEGDYQYFDSFFGSSSFSGQEIVYQKDKVCWSMNYFGMTDSLDFNGDFLKEALLKVDVKKPFRGPAFYQKGDYTYICECTGDVDLFHGNEIIYYQNEKIYQCFYHGGRCV